MRTIPIALQAHINGDATTTTHLLRIEPVRPGYPVLGITALDRDVTYDDGSGAVTYVAAIGMVEASLQSSADMDVDNTEIQHLLPEFDLPISEVDLNSGAYDFAAYRLHLVNYENLTQGHIELSRGQVGQVRIDNGLSWISELTSLAKLLKQSIVEKDSITCRATFGSQPFGTVGARVTERFPCGFDAESLYVDGTVGSVGAEASRTFSGTGTGANLVPGMVRWVTGNNAGREYEIEGQDGAIITLSFETAFPIVIGDTYKVRPDCTHWYDGANGCKEHWSTVGPLEWKLHYRGEPFIPLADADSINTPGATVGRGLA